MTPGPALHGRALRILLLVRAMYYTLCRTREGKDAN